MEIKNKVIVITGGSNGIGRACAINFISNNATVVIADVDEKNGKQLEVLLGSNCMFVKTDVTNEKEVTHLKNIVMKKYQKIDILINDAAKQTQNDFFDMTPNEFREVIDVNLNGTFICSNILGKEMLPGSQIINMLSVHYDLPRTRKYHYDASKAAVSILTKEMALELAEKGINVNGISYGACDTPMNADWIDNEEKVKETLSKIPLKWIAKPEEIAEFTKVILEKFCDYSTGSIYNIDGGRSLV